MTQRLSIRSSHKRPRRLRGLRPSSPQTVVVLLAALLCTSCDELDLNGRLGNGEFEYQCGGPGDAACDGTHAILGFDLDRDVLPVAVGSPFGLKFDGDEDAVLSPSSSLFAIRDGEAFRFVQVATVDFFAVNKGGQFLDFAPLSSRTASRIGVFQGGDEVTAVALRRFDETEIAAAPLGAGEVLGGGHSYQWSISGDGVDLLDAIDDDNVVHVEVRDFDAAATLSVSSGTFSASVLITASN